MISPDTMEEYIRKAGVLIEALPYIRAFEGKTVVVKYGGSAMEDPNLRRSTAEDIALMKYVGMNPVIVHGGGPEIGRMLKRLNIKSTFHEGLRITDDDTIDVVEMILTGKVNNEIVSLINRAGGHAIGLDGKDGDLLHARKIETEDGTDIGHVGDITSVHYHTIEVLCSNGMIPVIAPVATDESGGTWNVNADTAAGEVAATLQAEKLVFLTDTPGILANPEDESSLIHQLSHDDIVDLRKKGVIGGGMIPKVEACLKGLDYGVTHTHIIDGRVPHALLLEVFTKTGVGTMVSH